MARTVQVTATFSDARRDEAAVLDAAAAAERSAAQRLAPAASALAVSADGRWAALLSPQRAHVFDLGASEYHGPLPALEVRCYTYKIQRALGLVPGSSLLRKLQPQHCCGLLQCVEGP